MYKCIVICEVNTISSTFREKLLLGDTLGPKSQELTVHEAQQLAFRSPESRPLVSLFIKL